MADALRTKLTGRTILVLVFGFLYLPIAVLVLLVVQCQRPADDMVGLFAALVCLARQ
jgi:ABC-type spermidine/putrescine transport system permease subunit II